MDRLPFADAVRVRMLERVDRLIVVADDADICAFRLVRGRSLLSLVEILIFVGKDVFELAVLVGRRVLLEILH